MVIKWQKKTANKYSMARPSTPGHLKSYAYIHAIDEPKPVLKPIYEKSKKKRRKRLRYASGEYNKDWPKLSKQVRRDRNFTCEECGLHRPGRYGLVVHHLDEDKHNDDLTNLMVLCTHCHFKAHHQQ